MIKQADMINRIRKFLLLRGAKRMLNKKYYPPYPRSFKWGRLNEDDCDYEDDYFDEEDDCDDYEEETVRQKPFLLSRPRLRLSAEDFLAERFANKSLADMVNYYMHEKDLTSAIIYNRCFVDRRLLSKIVSNKEYHPSKETVFALCIGLKLTIRESKQFMGLAGYAINPNSKYDLLIEYALENKVYDIDMVNELLYSFHEKCFGE